MAKKKSQKQECDHKEELADVFAFFGMDYFRVMYVILTLLIIIVSIFYFLVVDEYKNLLFYQGVLATALFGVLLWFESVLRKPEDSGKMQKATKKSK
mmetsp:Transcript_26810/g.30950  ORF Transcript_26810/g.30950 Transcript_26810/m.30950 type:complete len:97 (+) Transcript_26810:16-306(+)